LDLVVAATPGVIRAASLLHLLRCPEPIQWSQHLFSMKKIVRAAQMMVKSKEVASFGVKRRTYA
jgi:hypothetical protein